MELSKAQVEFLIKLMESKGLTFSLDVAKVAAETYEKLQTLLMAMDAADASMPKRNKGA